MKRMILLLIVWAPLYTTAQITTPQVKARFGVDADLRANYFNGLVQAGNDDWFNLLAADTSGKAVIDTTGCAAIVAGYLADISPYPKRMASLFRTMSRPTFSIVNNRLWLDAIWIRDYHGNDSTVFTAGSDKNGMSPVQWSGGIQGIPDKNDILDMFMHIRRAGPGTTDSLWMFGGLSLDNTTGNRYFDFEMYQTDIYYDRVSGKWYGYGPDAGHTSWTFDASGNVLKPGDIIFSGEYQSSSLTNIEARVWVKKSVWQTVTPTAFNWSGLFDGDGAGAIYGYASISPKTAGAFYTGMGSGTNTWPGPFRLILQNNTMPTNYAKDQFMEFSVNLSKLGLDPVTQIGGDICGTPFNRIVVKTRASASFTSELKDFVAPTDLFLAPRAVITTQTPFMCDTGSVANLYVTNPVVTSVYQWSTPNGHILPPASGPSIFVDTPGTYIVKQYLQAGCSVYASDTIVVARLNSCVPLENHFLTLAVSRRDDIAVLDWTVLNNYGVEHFEIERSIDGIHFYPIGRVETHDSGGPEASYHFNDIIHQPGMPAIFYRIRLYEKTGVSRYSNIIRLMLENHKSNGITFFPNPVKNMMQMEVNASAESPVQVLLYDFTGKVVSRLSTTVHKGYNMLIIADLSDRPAGIYQVQAMIADEKFSQKIIVLHQ
jgi:hypothetical protein